MNDYEFFIGIDPGLTGAIAILSKNDGILFLGDMPVRSKGGVVGKEVSAVKLKELLCKVVAYKSILCLERVAARPEQGVAGMFSLGDSFGAVRGVSAGLGIFCVDVVPGVWRAGVGVKSNTGKEGSLGAARLLYPAAGEMLARKKDNGRADALLIAHYALRKWGG